MDRLSDLRTKIKNYFKELTEIPFSPPTLKYVTVSDEATDNYLLVVSGQQSKERVYRVDIHLSIQGNKVVLLEDNTEYGVLEDLIAAGIPQEDLVDATQDLDLIPQ